MTLAEVMQSLEEMGNENTKKIFTKHGAQEPFFGVKVQDLKKLQKKIKKDHELSIELFNTGNADAMYLAGLIADESKMTKRTLDDWAKKASWYMISEYTVPWIAADCGLGWEAGLKWIDSKTDKIASAGWAALSSHLSVCANENIKTSEVDKLLDRIIKSLHDSPNRVRYTMNGFVIAVGSYIPELKEKAQAAAEKIGKVHVDVGGTACKVPDAKSYIQKIADKGYTGKKRKMARC